MERTIAGDRRRARRFRSAVAPWLSALIVLAFGFITYAGARRLADATSLVTHTHAVIEQNELVIARLIDAETGERGFIITGDSTYLDPYRGAAADVDARLRGLRHLTADDKVTQARLDTLDGLARRRMAMFEARIALRRSAGFEATRADFLAFGGGKAITDSARRVVAAIEADEQDLLAKRTASQQRYESTVSWIVGAGALVAALLGLAISLMISRGAEAEARLGRELRARADEIEAANTLLQDQAAEMEMLNEELQTTNEQLEARTVEAEEANRVKADFLANMSHDLRTPLNAIIGYVDLLEGGVRGTLSADQHHDVVRIKRGATHLLALVNEVLDFAKIESGQQLLRIDEISIERVLAELRPLVEPQVAAKGLQFATSSEGVLVVRADREKLDQIFVNLVGNAIQFTAAGGRVDVECRADGVWMHADVRDSGEGIPEDRLDAIFAPFVQLDGRGPREARGVGLGLPISRHLARAMGGELTVTSVVGEGSTFTLRLPLVAE